VTSASLPLFVGRRDWRVLAPRAATGVLFAVLFAEPLATLLRDWWSDPEAGHGLLLGPLAVVLAWRRGRAPRAHARPGLGLAMLAAAILLRYASALAAELFTMRLSMLVAAAGLVVFASGVGQLRHWWLPAALLALSIPLPGMVVESLALPLQYQASALGASLLEWRHVPVQLTGNIIHLPGRSLFVTEACSGLRSLSALVALGVLIGGLWHRWVMSRAALVLAAIAVAILLNGLRVFLTGYIAFWIDPDLVEGFLHYTEGWVVFIAALGLLSVVSLLLQRLEQRPPGTA
jgi:exosortase